MAISNWIDWTSSEKHEVPMKNIGIFCLWQAPTADCTDGGEISSIQRYEACSWILLNWNVKKGRIKLCSLKIKIYKSCSISWHPGGWWWLIKNRLPSPTFPSSITVRFHNLHQCQRRGLCCSLHQIQGFTPSLQLELMLGDPTTDMNTLIIHVSISPVNMKSPVSRSRRCRVSVS